MVAEIYRKNFGPLFPIGEVEKVFGPLPNLAKSKEMYERYTENRLLLLLTESSSLIYEGNVPIVSCVGLATIHASEGNTERAKYYFALAEAQGMLI